MHDNYTKSKELACKVVEHCEEEWATTTLEGKQLYAEKERLHNELAKNQATIDEHLHVYMKTKFKYH